MWMQIGGRGIFTWHPVLLPWYYRLGGAKIGAGVVIHPKALLSDFDLITIGDGVCIDAALVRACPDRPSKKERQILIKTLNPIWVGELRQELHRNIGVAVFLEEFSLPCH